MDEEILYMDESSELSEEAVSLLYGREEETSSVGFWETLVLLSPVLVFIAACVMGYLIFSLSE